jgi:hypothetical protein
VTQLFKNEETFQIVFYRKKNKKIKRDLTEQLNTNSGEVDLNLEFQTRATPSVSTAESSYEANKSSGYLKNKAFYYTVQPEAKIKLQKPKIYEWRPV